MNSMLVCRIIFRKDFNFPKFHYFFFLAQMILMIIQSTWTWIRHFLRMILTYRTFLNHPPYSINWLQGTKRDERPTEMFHPVPECIQRLAREEGKVNWDNFYDLFCWHIGQILSCVKYGNIMRCHLTSFQEEIQNYFN